MKNNAVIRFVKEKHSRQTRRGGEEYINHVLQVGKMSREIAETSLDKFPNLKDRLDDIYHAGLLHDTVEDTNTNYDTIQSLTNDRVAMWVAALSNDKRLPRDLRRSLYLKTIASSCAEVKIVKLADVYSNLTGLRFNEGDEWILQFLQKSHDILQAIRSELSSHKLFVECEEMIKRIKESQGIEN